MYFGNRWVPMGVMDTIVLLWVVLTVIVIAIIVWLHRKKTLSPQKEKQTPHAPDKKDGANRH